MGDAEVVGVVVVGPENLWETLLHTLQILPLMSNNISLVFNLSFLKCGGY